MQYIDCFAQITSEPSKLKLFFFVPIKFVEEDYDLTLVEYRQLHSQNRSSDLLKGKLNKYQLTTPYVFSPPALLCSSNWKFAFSIGTIISHSGSSDSFETRILLSGDKPALLTAPIDTVQLLPSSTEIKCMEYSAVIKYPYPVTEVVVQRHESKKGRSLTIFASRLRHEYIDDGQLFHVNPNDRFRLIPVMPSIDSLEFQLKSQFSPNEWELFCTDDILSDYPVLKAKRFIFLMLTMNDLFFRLQVEFEGTIWNAGLIKIINRVIDITRKTVALDVYFCLCDEFDGQSADSITLPIVRECFNSPFDVKNFPVTKKAYYLIKAFILSFHKHTYQCEKSFPLAIKPPSLEKCKIKQFFKRAVIYPLYQDRDKAIHDMQTAKNCPHFKFISPISFSEIKDPLERKPIAKPNPELNSLCSYCGKIGQTKKCSRCHKVSYCGKECQRKDWSQHKKICMA